MSTSAPRLRVPDPTTSLGERPAVGPGSLAAGAVERPPVDVAAAQVRHLAYELVRVLDDDGRPVGPWDPELDRDALVTGLRHMVVVRELDRRMLLAQRQGKTSFYMQSTGEEAVSCAFAAALRAGDMNFPTYRQQGLLVAGGYPLVALMSQVYSNAADPLHGRQMPVFYSSRAHGFFSISGNLGTQFSQAVGWGMGAAIKGSDDVAVAWIGEGATAEADFHAGMVFASTYGVPVVLVIVNNQWAISTPQAVAVGGSDTFAAKAHGFGMPGLRVDGNDYLAVHAAARWSISRARANEGPTLIELVTYRAGAHSSSDDPSGYRTQGEAEAWPLGDPIDRLHRHLCRSGGWSDDDLAQLQEAAATEVKQAQEESERHGTLDAGSHWSPKDMFEDVYEHMPPHLRHQRQASGY